MANPHSNSLKVVTMVQNQPDQPVSWLTCLKGLASCTLSPGGGLAANFYYELVKQEGKQTMATDAA